MMKIKDGYILKKVAGENIVVATGNESLSFNGIITFNEVGAEVFALLDGNHTENEIVDELLKMYNAPREIISKDVKNLIEKMKKQGLLED